MKHIVLLFSLALLAACSATPKFDQPSMGGPKLDLEEYFDGNLKAYGQFQDITGRVRDRFTVDIEGRFDGRVLTLVEDFDYSDGRKDQRIWKLTKTGPDTWDGWAEGVQTVAKGIEQDDRFNFTYVIEVPSVDGPLRLEFDDWLWRIDEDRVLNKAYLKRYGLPIGEVIIWFERI